MTVEQFEHIRSIVAATFPSHEFDALALGLAFLPDTDKQRAIDAARDDVVEIVKLRGVAPTDEIIKMALTAFAQVLFERIEAIERAQWGAA